MTYQITLEREILPTEGSHPVTIVDIRDKGFAETKYGEKDLFTIVFRIEDQAYNGKPVDWGYHYSKSLHARSALTKLLSALAFSDCIAFNSDELIGKTLNIEIKHRRTAAGILANIVNYPRQIATRCTEAI